MKNAPDARGATAYKCFKIHGAPSCTQANRNERNSLIALPNTKSNTHTHHAPRRRAGERASMRPATAASMRQAGRSDSTARISCCACARPFSPTPTPRILATLSSELSDLSSRTSRSCERPACEGEQQRVVILVRSMGLPRLQLSQHVVLLVRIEEKASGRGRAFAPPVRDGALDGRPAPKPKPPLRRASWRSLSGRLVAGVCSLGGARVRIISCAHT